MKAAILFVFILFFSFMPMSYAVSGDSDAGIMPGSFLYSFDLFFERIELFFAFNQQKKARTLVFIARERELELEALDDDMNERYSSALVARRDIALDKARRIIQESGPDDSSMSELLEEIDDISSGNIIDEYQDVNVEQDNGDGPVEDNRSDVTPVLSEEEPVVFKPVGPKLSDLQETACLAAEKGNTCNTRLSDLGLVTKDECCASLGVCCS